MAETGLTAGELAEAMSKLPPDTPVFTRGHEAGLDRADGFRIGMMMDAENEEGAWYFGDFNWCDPEDPTPEGAFTGVRIGNEADG